MKVNVMAIDIKKGLKAAAQGYKNERKKIAAWKNSEEYLKKKKEKAYWHKFQRNVSIGVFCALSLWTILMMVLWFFIYVIVIAAGRI